MFPAFGYAETVSSPDGLTVLTTGVSAAGTPVYSLVHNGKTILEDSPLGFVANTGDYSRFMTLKGSTRSEVNKNYTQDKIKRHDISYHANTLTTEWENPHGGRMSIEWQVSDNNVAFRYLIPVQGETRAMVVLRETTGYRFPTRTTTFLTPQSDAMIGWKRTKPSYEEYYVTDAPMDSVSGYGHGYTFPCLFHVGDDGWALLTETGVDGYYCASHLSDYHDGVYTIAYPMSEENNGNGSASPGIALPGKTPWRTITVSDGHNLAPIVETTIPWDLVDPLYTTDRPARPGRGTWSWLLWQDGSINYDDQVRFIDLAAEMGYENTLIDNWWNTNIGRERMAGLARYARGKGVNLILWYSSSGHWNDIEQGPTGLMDRPIVRKAEMKWLKEIGVNAIKVDFFGGDKQETMRLYEDILSDAADYGIDVVFHGCTMPRGWERMYPNYVGSEAVLASENLVFSQDFCDLEAFHATMHPFIRNTAGIMEYGGTILNKRFHKKADKGNVRRTSDAFQLATSVLFQNPVQNFALVPNNLTDAPADAIEFMKGVPVTWDETRFLDGYPGRYVLLARRHGSTWYIAGANATDRPVILKTDLSGLLKKGDKATVYADEPGKPLTARRIRLGNPEQTAVTIYPQGGYVMVSE